MSSFPRRVLQIAALTAMAVLFAASLVLAQGLSDDELALLKQMTPEERARIMEAYGLPPSSALQNPARDTSNPRLSTPRQEETSRVEEDLSASPVAEALGSAAKDRRAARQAFSDFMSGYEPFSIDKDLKQFGYDLFASVPSTFAPATDIPVGPDYIVGPGDELRIQLFGKTNLSVSLVVDRDGLIAFPELGPLSVAGLDFQQLRETIAREVKQRMIGVDVSVTMGRLRSIRVFVLGEVHSPGAYSVSGLSGLANALIASGGIEKIGSLRRVQLKRSGKLVAELDLYDLLLSGDMSSDKRLLPSDVIFVPPVGSLVGVAGEVRRPAIYELNGETSAAAMLRLAGGLNAAAFTDRLQVDRIENGQRVVYDLSLSDAENWTMHDGDLLKVFSIPDREEKIVSLSGNVLRPGKQQWYEGMRLTDLLPSADDLLPETHFDYALIERESPLNREPEFVAFDLGAALLHGRQEENLPLAARDHVFVFHRAHFREEPLVSIRGRVSAPGEFTLRKDMRVLDLVLAAGGLLRDAWTDEAELFRTDPVTREVTRRALRLDAVLRRNPAENIPLQDLDEVAIHSVWEFRHKREVEVLGEVNYPGTYPLFEGMRVSDLLFAGGSLKEEAYQREAELTRYEVMDGERRELQHLSLDLAAVLAGQEDANLLLQPDDRLLVRRISNWRAQETVTVTGELAFPGTYPIEDGEHLSDLIERCGGFLDDAYLPAAFFSRDELMALERQQLDRLATQLEADLARLTVQIRSGVNGKQSENAVALEAGKQLAKELRSTKATGRLVINLSSASDLKGSADDLLLKDGDKLHVPKVPDYIVVMGQVSNPTALRWRDGMTAKGCIELAGGSTRFADSRRSYVVSADGSVRKGRRIRLMPGDVVVVPENLERFSGMQFVLDLSQVAYQIGLAAASAKTVGVW